MNRLSEVIGLSLILGVLHSTSASAAPVAPSFTTGTVTSRTESTTTVSEIINQVDYTTGSSYTVSGTNIDFAGTPSLDTPYELVVPGGSFQFSETHLGPGIARETFIDRTTTIFSVTESTSVFTQ